MAQRAHEHEYEHAPTPAHEHDEPVTHEHAHPEVMERPTAYRRPATGSMIARVVLTLAAAGGIIVSAFLEWTRGLTAVHMSDRAFFEVNFAQHAAFVTSAGFIMFLIGILAIVGLAPRVGWLIRIAGVLAILGFVLFTVQLARDTGANLPEDIGIGAWIALAGGIVALIAGFLPEHRIMRTEPAPVH